MELHALPLTYRATIKAEYLDHMGHMNVMWYTHLFDQATWAFFAQVGMDKAYFEEHSAGCAALEQHTHYLAELRHGANVSLRSRALGRSPKRLHFMHFMVNEDAGVLAATTEIVGIHIDRDARRSSPLPASIAATIDRLLAEHQALNWDAPVCGLMEP